MKLFVGYPISYETACNFFNLPIGTKYLEKEIEDAGLVFQYVDKGQFILGLGVDIGNLFDTFLGVDNSIIQILQRKKDVIERMKLANIDLSDFMLQPLGEEAWQSVSNPEPYLMSI